jgi:hypothetical protein
MVTIVCDTCRAEARPNIEKRNSHAPWIQGYDLRVESPTLVQHSVRLLDRWDDRRIAEFGAVHFCSLECKDKYLAKNKAA